MRRAQMQTQIFIYIMVLVIGAGILWFGYNAISGIKKQSDDILYIQFEEGFKNDVKSIAYQSVRIKKYSLPQSIQQICFRSKDAKDYGDVGDKYPLIATAVQQGSKDNVFIYPKGERSFFAGANLEVDPDKTFKFGCIDVKSGVLSVRIKGQGDTVLITE